MIDETKSEGVTEQPLFTITGLGIGAETVFAPRSVQELKSWLGTERDFWRWLREVRSGEHYVQRFKERQWWGDGEIDGYIANYEANPSANVAHIVKTGERIASRYHQQGALHSSSPHAAYVAEVAKKDHRVAASLGLVFSGETPQNLDRFSTMGTALAASFLYGPASAPDSFKTAWSQTLSGMSNEHENLRRSAGAAADEWTQRRNDISELHEAQKQSFSELQTMRQTEFTAMTDDHEQRLEQIEETFKGAMALRSSVKYFRDKADEHGKTGRNFAIASGLVAIASAAGVLWVAMSVFGSNEEVTKTQIGVAVVLAFLDLWLLRLLVRILLSNLHLSTDMRNRATLVQAYLALIAEGAALKDEDRARIVNLVFRPASDGLVRDDGAPPTLFSMFQRSASGG